MASETGEGHQGGAVGVVEQVHAVAKAYPLARVVAFADLSSRMILCSAGSEDLNQEHLNRLCADAMASFDDPLAALAVEAFGEAQGSLVIDADGVRVFLRSEVEPTDVMCCICDHAIDLTGFVATLRATLEQIGAQPT